MINYSLSVNKWSNLCCLCTSTPNFSAAMEDLQRTKRKFTLVWILNLYLSAKVKFHVGISLLQNETNRLTQPKCVSLYRYISSIM